MPRPAYRDSGSQVVRPTARRRGARSNLADEVSGEDVSPAMGVRLPLLRRKCFMLLKIAPAAPIRAMAAAPIVI